MRAIGWDVGGANVKAALVDGGTARAVTRPFALWRERHALGAVLQGIARELGSADAMAATMTAEVADCFEDRAQGVRFVLDALESAFPKTPLHVFSSHGRFIPPHDARRDPAAVGSANWMATATWFARSMRDAILIDVGTTTTDVIPIVNGEVVAEGRTDLDRLSNGELVYTGVVRTSCTALARTVLLRGRRQRVVAERFAQSGDVHLWLRNLAEADYLGETPDGRGKSRAEAGARLARVVGADAGALGESAVTELASQLSERQVRQVTAAIRQVRARLGERAPREAVAVGVGAFLGVAAAERVGLITRDWADEVGAEASCAAPAVAVARLLGEDAR